MVITHSPQVAARGTSHLRIIKTASGGQATDAKDSVITTVDTLDAAARREEIARMLSGAEVTDAARAQADALMAVKA